MTKGGPGIPKSDDHRRAIGQAMRAKSEVKAIGQRKAAEGLLEAAALLSGGPTPDNLATATVRLVHVIEDLVAAAEANVEIADSKRAELESLLARTGSELSDSQIEKMDVLDISAARRLGLLSGKVAERELARRRREFSTSGGWGA